MQHFNRLLQTCLIATVSLVFISCGKSGDRNRGSTSTVQINGIPVPPDPGAAADSTVVGIDSNRNGLRDEVERQIAITYGANPTQYDGVMKLAMTLQPYLVANGNSSQATLITQMAVVAGACSVEKFDGDAIAAQRAATYMFALTVNTPERFAAYRATSAASKEIATSIPSQPCE